MKLAAAVDMARQWQTLIAGLLALLGAFLTVWIGRRQIRAAGDRAAEMRERQFLAARALMPADLSEICAYTDHCAALISQALQYFDEHGEPPPDLKAPELPERVPANLQRLIEQLDEANAHAVADLLGCYQVQRARLEGALREWCGLVATRATPVFSRRNVEHPLSETIHLRVLADSMFEFARRETGCIARVETVEPEQFRSAVKMFLGPGFPSTERDEELAEHMRMNLGIAQIDHSHGTS